MLGLKLIHVSKRGYFPDSQVHGANTGPTWVLSAPDGPHVGPMNLVIKVVMLGAAIVLIQFQNIPASSPVAPFTNMV